MVRNVKGNSGGSRDENFTEGTADALMFQSHQFGCGLRKHPYDLVGALKEWLKMPITGLGIRRYVFRKGSHSPVPCGAKYEPKSEKLAKI